MIIGLSIILIITSLLMVLLVLLHKGKGGGLSDLFGGGMSSSLGSSSVVERNLDRLTIFSGAVWFLCIVGLNLLLNHGGPQGSGEGKGWSVGSGNAIRGSRVGSGARGGRGRGESAAPERESVW